MSARLPAGGRVSRVPRIAMVRVISDDAPANDPLTTEERRLADMFSGSLEDGRKAEIEVVEGFRREGLL